MFSDAQQRPTPATASPYICLSTPYDFLYQVAGRPHAFAAISEQSVYSRATEQLRFATPSPITSSAAVEGGATTSLLPHVCLAPHPPQLLPTIASLEAAVAEQERRTPAAPQRDPAAAPRDGLVPSGCSLAHRTYAHCFEDRRHGDTRGRTAATTPAAAAAATTAASPVAALAGNTVPLASTTAHDASSTAPSPSSPPQRMFSSAVHLRAVAQMTLMMQASTGGSAARFALVRYRGAQLLPWTASRDAPLMSPALSHALQSPETLLVSVLPQVVTDSVVSAAAVATQPGTAAPPQVTNNNSSGSSSSAPAPTLYAFLPLGEADTAVWPMRGAKRDRDDTDGAARNTEIAKDGEVLCARLPATPTAPIADGGATRYAAVAPPAFDEWTRQVEELHDGGTPATSLAVPQPSRETHFYGDEPTWLSSGVFRPVFAVSASAVLAGGGDGAVSDAEEDAAHATAVKTSAFLLLSFLVHHTWCTHVHVAVAAALAAHPPLLEAAATPTVTHIVCLPPVEEARRSPQHAWRAVLVYRLHRSSPAAASPAGASGDTSHSAGGAASESLRRDTAAQALRHGPVAWQLSVLVVNRSAELRWHVVRTGREESGSSGTLKELLHHLKTRGE